MERVEEGSRRFKKVQEDSSQEGSRCYKTVYKGSRLSMKVTKWFKNVVEGLRKYFSFKIVNEENEVQSDLMGLVHSSLRRREEYRYSSLLLPFHRGLSMGILHRGCIRKNIYIPLDFGGGNDILFFGQSFHID